MERASVRILLVDDDLVDRLACRRALGSHPDYDFELLEAATGREGIELARSSHPGLILLDYHLPDLDGIGFLAEMRALDAGSDIPVLMLTGADNVGMAVQAMRHGARDYLVKDGERTHLQLLPAVIERVLREQRLDSEKRAAEARFRTLVEQIPAITYMAASDGSARLFYISPQAGALGLDPQRLLEDPEGVLAQVHPQDREELRAVYERCCHGGGALHHEYRVLDGEGTIHWLLDEARLVPAVDGTPPFLQGVRIDITEDRRTEDELRQRLEHMVDERTARIAEQTRLLATANTRLLAEIEERRQVEAALRTSEERFRLLLESAGEGIYGLDTQGRCTFVNDAALEMLGYQREEMLGLNTHELIHHSHGDGTPYPVGQCRIYDAFRTGVASRTQVESLWRADGTTLSVEYSSHPLRVGDKILGAVLVFRDVTEAQARATRLAWQASHDALTGLVNRREFEIRLANAIDSARSKGDAHALCYLDLDHFKAVNDNCGHAAGDELLRHVSQLLHQRLRQRDTLARLGGDEFGVLLEHCPVGKAVEIARELCAVVRELRFTWEGHEFRIGASIGVAPIDSSVRDVATLMSAADAACYAAKAAGRGRVHLVDETAAQAPHVRP